MSVCNIQCIEWPTEFIGSRAAGRDTLAECTDYKWMDKISKVVLSQLFDLLFSAKKIMKMLVIVCIFYLCFFVLVCFFFTKFSENADIFSSKFDFFITLF